MKPTKKKKKTRNQLVKALDNVFSQYIRLKSDAELAARHRVNTVPGLFLYRAGQCVGQRSGLASKKDLLHWVGM